MADSKLRDISTDFAVKVIKMCDGVKGHYSLCNHNKIHTYHRKFDSVFLKS